MTERTTVSLKQKHVTIIDGNKDALESFYGGLSGFLQAKLEEFDRRSVLEHELQQVRQEKRRLEEREQRLHEKIEDHDPTEVFDDVDDGGFWEQELKNIYDRPNPGEDFQQFKEGIHKRYCNRFDKRVSIDAFVAKFKEEADAAGYDVDRLEKGDN